MLALSSEANHECYISESVLDELSLNNDIRKEIRRMVCEKLSAAKEHNGHAYCILHYPTTNKKEEFKTAYENKKNVNDFNFQWVYFPDDLVLTDKTISGDTDFSNAHFTNKVYLKNAKFERKVSFENARIDCGLNIDHVAFLSDVIFQHCRVENEFSINDTAFKGETTFQNARFLKNFQGEGKIFITYNLFRKETIFNDSHFFIPVTFEQSVFKGRALFRGAKFEGETSFEYVSFEKLVKFENSKFIKKVLFNRAGFMDYARFEGNRNNEIFHQSLELQNLRIVNAENVYFHSVSLYPHWFVDSDPRKFVFTNVDWKNVENGNTKANTESELKNLDKQSGIENPKQLLKTACRQLAENAENNNRFEQASIFRRMAFEIEWLELKEKVVKWGGEEFTVSEFFSDFGKKIKSMPFDLFHSGYRWSSGYGENRSWAFFVLFLIVIISAILYSTPLSQFPNGTDKTRSLEIVEAISYSLRVMVLQRPEPFPVNTFGKVILALESVLAPLQLALLALAIRRKFMR